MEDKANVEYLISKSYRNILVLSFFIMMSAFGYYPYRYNERKKTKENQLRLRIKF